jgi:hypothetical protein
MTSNEAVRPKRSSSFLALRKWALWDQDRRKRPDWRARLHRPAPKSTPRNSEEDWAAISGNMDQMGFPGSKRIVRFFLSSTFDDTFFERNLLLEDVLPYLKECARNRGLEVALSEMRFGIRDKASSDNKTSEICMDELQYCQEVSAGINYILISGDKYGFRPCPARILKTEFEALLTHMPAEHARLASDCYLLDENAHESPEYVMRNREEINGLQHGAHDELLRAFRAAAERLWSDKLEELRDPFRCGTKQPSHGPA